MQFEAPATYAQLSVESIAFRGPLRDIPAVTNTPQQYAVVSLYQRHRTDSSIGLDKPRLLALSNPIRLPDTLFQKPSKDVEEKGKCENTISLSPSLVHAIKKSTDLEIELVLYLLPHPDVVLSSQAHHQAQSQHIQQRDEAQAVAHLSFTQTPPTHNSHLQPRIAHINGQPSHSKVTDSRRGGPPAMVSVTGTALPNVTPEALALIQMVEAEDTTALKVIGRSAIDLDVNPSTSSSRTLSLTNDNLTFAQISIEYFSNTQLEKVAHSNQKEVILASIKVEAVGAGADLITAMTARAEQQRRFALAEALKAPTTPLAEPYGNVPSLHQRPSTSVSFAQHIPKVLINGGNRWAATAFDCPFASLIAQATSTDPFTAAGALAEALDPRAATVASVVREAGSLLQAPSLDGLNSTGRSSTLQNISTPFLPLVTEMCGLQAEEDTVASSKRSARAARKERFQSNSFAIAVMEPVASQHIETSTGGNCGVPCLTGLNNNSLSNGMLSPTSALLDIPRLPIAVTKFTTKDIHRWLTRENTNAVGSTQCTFYDERVGATVSVEETVFEGEGPSHGKSVLKITVKMCPTATEEEINVRLCEQENEDEVSEHLNDISFGHPHPSSSSSLRAIAARRAVKNAATLHKNTLYKTVIVIHSMPDWLSAMRGEDIYPDSVDGGGVEATGALPWKLVLQGARGRAKAAKYRQKVEASEGNEPFANRSEKREALWLLRVQRWRAAVEGVRNSLPLTIGCGLSEESSLDMYSDREKQKESNSKIDSDHRIPDTGNVRSLTASSAVIRAHFESVLMACIQSSSGTHDHHQIENGGRAINNHATTFEASPLTHSIAKEETFVSRDGVLHSPVRGGGHNGGMSLHSPTNYLGDDEYQRMRTPLRSYEWIDQPSMLQQRSANRDKNQPNFHSLPDVPNPTIDGFASPLSSGAKRANQHYNELSPPMAHRTGYSLDGYTDLMPPRVHERHLSPLGHGHYLTTSPMTPYRDGYVVDSTPLGGTSATPVAPRNMTPGSFMATPSMIGSNAQTELNYSAKKISHRLERADLTMGRNEQLQRGGIGPMSSVSHIVPTPSRSLPLPHGMSQPSLSNVNTTHAGLNASIAERTLASLEDRMSSNGVDGTRPNDFLNLRGRANVSGAKLMPSTVSPNNRQTSPNRSLQPHQHLILTERAIGNTQDRNVITALPTRAEQNNALLSRYGLTPEHHHYHHSSATFNSPRGVLPPITSPYNQDLLSYPLLYPFPSSSLVAAQQDRLARTLLSAEEQPNPLLDINAIGGNSPMLLPPLPDSIMLSPSDVLFLTAFHFPESVADMAPLYYTALFAGVLSSPPQPLSPNPLSEITHTTLDGGSRFSVHTDVGYLNGSSLYPTMLSSLQAATATLQTQLVRSDALTASVENAASRRMLNKSRRSQLYSFYIKSFAVKDTTQSPGINNNLFTHLFSSPELEALLSALLKDPLDDDDELSNYKNSGLYYHNKKYQWTSEHLWARAWLLVSIYWLYFLPSVVISIVVTGVTVVGAFKAGKIFLFGAPSMSKRSLRRSRRRRNEGLLSLFGFGRGPNLNKDTSANDTAVSGIALFKSLKTPKIISSTIIEPLSILCAVPFLGQAADKINIMGDEEMVGSEVDVVLDGSSDTYVVSNKKLFVPSGRPNFHHGHRYVNGGLLERSSPRGFFDPYNPYVPTPAQYPAAKLVGTGQDSLSYSVYSGINDHQLLNQNEYPQRVYSHNLLNFNESMFSLPANYGNNLSRQTFRPIPRPNRTSLLNPHAPTANNQDLLDLSEATESYRIYKELGLLASFEGNRAENPMTSVSSGLHRSADNHSTKISLDTLTKILTVALIKGQECNKNGKVTTRRGRMSRDGLMGVSCATTSSQSVAERARKLFLEGRCCPLWVMLVGFGIAINLTVYIFLWQLEMSLSPVLLVGLTAILVPKSPLLVALRLFLRLFMTAEELN